MVVYVSKELPFGYENKKGFLFCIPLTYSYLCSGIQRAKRMEVNLIIIYQEDKRVIK